MAPLTAPQLTPSRPRPIPGAAALFAAAETGDLRKIDAALASGTPVDIADQRTSPTGTPTLLTPLCAAATPQRLPEP